MREWCGLCKKDACEHQYNRVISGNAESNILLIRFVPTTEEAERQKLWCDDAGARFKMLMSNFFVDVGDVATAVLVKCPLDKVKVRNIRACREQFDKTLNRKQWKYIICGGREVTKHVFMRGGAPPPMDILAGRLVNVPEITTAKVTTIPDPASLTVLQSDDFDDAVIRRLELTRTSLIELKKVMVI
jgi:uracil-DNA glycosylase